MFFSRAAQNLHYSAENNLDLENYFYWWNLQVWGGRGHSQKKKKRKRKTAWNQGKMLKSGRE